MKPYIFNSIQDVLKSIEESGYNRNLSSLIGFEYVFEEDNQFQFGEKLDEYSFFFYFLDEEQSELTDEEFEETILRLISLGENITPLNVRKILYSKQLLKIDEKFSKNLITKEVYENLRNKYLK